MKKANIFRTMKGIAFVLVFYLMFHGTSSVFVNPDPDEDHRIFHWIHDFYDEPEDSLDAVFIGSSVVQAYWLSPVAYKKYGITVWPYCSGGQSLSLAQSIIQNTKKNHENALFIISTNGIWEKMPQPEMHWFMDYLPRSLENLLLIARACRSEDRSLLESIEYVFPLIQYHTRWSALKSEDFHYGNNGLKGGTKYNVFLKDVSDASDRFGNIDMKAEISPKFISVVNSLLDYCSQEPEKYLFVTSPWCDREEMKAKVNTVNDMIRERGFPVLNLLECLEETGLDPQTDYSDPNHTNIHGAIKFTDYLSQYILDHYDFPKRSGGYESWDKAYDKYKEIIIPYLTDEELKQLP